MRIHKSIFWGGGRKLRAQLPRTTAASIQAIKNTKHQISTTDRLCNRLSPQKAFAVFPLSTRR